MSIETNPYRKNLGDRNAQEVIAGTSERINKIFEKLGPDGLERSYAPGKWSARQIMCHLADCEIAFGFRLRQTLAAPNHVIQPFDQDLWAKHYGTLDGAAAFLAFANLRHWNLALLKELSPEDYKIPASHPERGSMTFATIVETMAGHDLNHLAQLETI
jgi:hypothetical protein